MTERRDEMPPPAAMDRTVIREGVREAVELQFRPLIVAWDKRSEDMLAVLAEAADAKRVVANAARSIKLAGWCGVFAFVAAAVLVWLVLESERGERRRHRDAEQLRRAEAAMTVVEQVRAEGRRIVEECRK